MGHLGFSYIGLIFLMMLTVPNLIWTRHQPQGYDSQDENKILLVFERVGQVCVTCTALIFSDFNPPGLVRVEPVAHCGGAPDGDV